MNRTTSAQVEPEVGDYGVVTKAGSVRFERVLPGPVERIWAYLTEQAKLRKWLASARTAIRSEGPVVLTWNHSELSPHVEPTPERFKQYQGEVTRWRVTHFEPQRLLRCIWNEGSEGESEVTFELTPRGDEVLLVVTHERLTDRSALVDVASGWHTHLAILSDNLEGREARPFWSTHTRLTEEYDKRLN